MPKYRVQCYRCGTYAPITGDEPVTSGVAEGEDPWRRITMDCGCTFTVTPFLADAIAALGAGDHAAAAVRDPDGGTVVLRRGQPVA